MFVFTHISVVLTITYLCFFSSSQKKRKSTMEVLQRDGDVINALKKNGYPPTAPKNSCGCKHFAFSDMKVLKHTDVQHYSANEKMKDLFDRKCSNPGCKNGVFGTSWPIKKIVGDRVQGYWCAYPLTWRMCLASSA